jgi:hypothetical protein
MTDLLTKRRPGQEDSVVELADLWGGMEVFKIYLEIAWGSARAGSNAPVPAFLPLPKSEPRGGSNVPARRI